MSRLVFSFITLLAFCRFAQGADVTFAPRELFRIPFGDDRAALGTRVDGSQLRLPSSFTLDTLGRVYIDDKANHRVVRLSPIGAYEASYRYPATARQVFAHADARMNLWLLVADPSRGVYYGVYSPQGQPLRSATFTQFNRFKLHVGDDFALRARLSSDSRPKEAPLYRFDSETLLMKKEDIAPPPETHHRVSRGEAVYFVDQVPGASKDAAPVHRITDRSQRVTGEIQGEVLYVTDQGDLYTRLGACEFRVYDVVGTLKGKVRLTGLPASCAGVRFDARGNLYQLDGIPNEADKTNPYTSEMPGMRMILWERHD